MLILRYLSLLAVLNGAHVYGTSESCCPFSFGLKTCLENVGEVWEKYIVPVFEWRFVQQGLTFYEETLCTVDVWKINGISEV